MKNKKTNLLTSCSNWQVEPEVTSINRTSTTSCRRQRVKVFEGDLFWRRRADWQRCAGVVLAPCWLFKCIYFRPVLACHPSRPTGRGLILEMAEMNKSPLKWGSCGCHCASSIHPTADLCLSAWGESTKVKRRQGEERMWTWLSDQRMNIVHAWQTESPHEKVINSSKLSGQEPAAGPPQLAATIWLNFIPFLFYNYANKQHEMWVISKVFRFCMTHDMVNISRFW